MKELLAILCILFFAPSAAGQNHVPNGDFEDFTQCPGSFSELHRATGWKQYTGGTPDYFNPCATFDVDVPANWFGNQQPASGNGYAGVYCYNQLNDYKEYMIRHITPLAVGVRYEVSMSVSLADTSMYATDDLGVFFYIKGPSGLPSLLGNVTLTPQVSYTGYGILNDKQNWVRLTQSFIADSAYNKIIIGGFAPRSTQGRQQFASGMNFAYYYIDSVVVKALDTVYRPPVDTTAPPVDTTIADSFSITFDDIAWCAGKSVSIDLFYIVDTFFSKDNIFHLQLSDSIGDFISPVNLGSLKSDAPGKITGVIPPNILPGRGYRIRIISTSPVYTWLSDQVITIVPGPDLATNKKLVVCPGTDIRLYAKATDGSIYKWTGPGLFDADIPEPVIKNADANHEGVYTVTATHNSCSVKDTVHVSIGCGVVELPKAFSPNGDGNNDVLYVRTNGELKEIDFRIYNRWGEQVFQANNPKAGWDGTYKGKVQNPEAFGYIITGRFGNDTPFVKKGYVLIVR